MNFFKNKKNIKTSPHIQGKACHFGEVCPKIIETIRKMKIEQLNKCRDFISNEIDEKKQKESESTLYFDKEGTEIKDGDILFHVEHLSFYKFIQDNLVGVEKLCKQNPGRAIYPLEVEKYIKISNNDKFTMCKLVTLIKSIYNYDTK